MFNPCGIKDLLIGAIDCVGAGFILVVARRVTRVAGLIARHRRGAALWRTAVWAAPLMLAAALAACSGLAASNEQVPAASNEPAPVSNLDPGYRQIVADRLRSSFKSYAAYDAFQIAEPRWVHAVQGWSWVVCVRFQDHGRPRTYAVFLQLAAVIDSRYAVETDGCDTQAYAPFDLMAGGLQPLH